MTDEWITLQKASEITGKSPAALRMWIKRRTEKGELVRVKKERRKAGETWVIHTGELEAFGELVRAGVHPAQVTSVQGEPVNTVTLEYYDKQRAEWANERDELRSGLQMYRWKFEELDRKIKLLPAPPEIITHELEQAEELLKLEQKEKADLARRMEDETKEREAQEKTLRRERDDLQHSQEETKAAMAILEALTREEKERLTREKAELETRLEEERKARELAEEKARAEASKGIWTRIKEKLMGEI